MSQKKTTYITDYRPLLYTCKRVELVFDLDEEKTIVQANLVIERVGEHTEPCILQGEELKLLSLSIDGVPLSSEAYRCDQGRLLIERTSKSFTCQTVVEISPKKNTSLCGLYMSQGMLCTQNEPEGFRKITYFFDRPDCLSTYKVTLRADKKRYPILLANGNEKEKKELPDGRHQAVWEDPFPKPCYLFAIVAGDLTEQTTTYTTLTGKKKELRIYCDKGNEEKCLFALDSLKKAMRWDEEIFKREYDLDLFMIVAVDAFNFGAMENKGLNIFNSSCVLVDPKVTTDDTFKRVEAIVAHEYFHNWTGNRITLRDWFQLTLKEGLTVFREQQFCMDQHDPVVQRIHDVQFLFKEQFSEDAGPTAHPIRPETYIEVDNFYTPTVYEKGAEVIRMCKTLLGDEAFSRAIQEYFRRYDGQAITCEDFLCVVEDIGKKDFTQFRYWYSQSGTPIVSVETRWEPKEKKLHLLLMQKTLPTADQLEKKPLQFPFKVGFLAKEGASIEARCAQAVKQSDSWLLELTQETQIFTFTDVEKEPVLSLNRGFSAPVILQTSNTKEELAFLAKNDPDLFNRWYALQTLAKEVILEAIEKQKVGKTPVYSPLLFTSLENALFDKHSSFSYLAELLSLPAEEEILQQQSIMDFEATRFVCEDLAGKIGQHLLEGFKTCYKELHAKETGATGSVFFAKRKLKNVCLAYLIRANDAEAAFLASKQFKEALTMTDELAALQLLINYVEEEKEDALSLFYSRWKEEPLALLKWFSLQSQCRTGNPLATVKNLLKHKKYQDTIPNHVRAVIGGFVHNLPYFHKENGEGYRFVAEQILYMDKINPFIASALAKGFNKIARVSENRQLLMQKELQNVLKEANLSSNVYEVVHKCLESLSRKEEK